MCVWCMCVCVWVLRLFFLFYFFKKNRAAKTKTRNCKIPKRPLLPLFIKTSAVTGGTAHYTLPGILARLRAMASSTALSCFRSSSLRDRVLDLLPLAAPGPGSEPLPGTLVTLLELLD